MIPAGDIPAVTVVIVTWNCRDLALRCLRELAAADLPGGREVIVVDNASADGTAAALAQAFPDVRVIANTANTGFAAANNQALALARGRYALLLNPDAFPTAADSLASLVACLDADQRLAAAGCRLVHEDGRHQVGDAGWRPGFWSLSLHALGLTQVLPRRLRGVFLVRPDALGPGPVGVDWICGACMLVRMDAVRQVGGLDAGFFMYAEDVEWGCRLRAAGLGVAYLPRSRVLHLQGGTQGGVASTRWLDNLVRLHCVLNGRGSLPLLRPVLATGFALRALAYRLVALRPGGAAARGRARVMWQFARHAWRLAPGPVA
ncbi:glycosyltransferase family 2 protein [Humitalea sp. 24SJ18S-53]|uniref:glycosyltransferase family 2 protein n=1 Tax=Humitalea sp. 24SJ18S-53 TaxID=3422307 RepID=UPI003D67EBD5